MTGILTTCAVCGRPVATKACARCRTLYCSPHCQQEHWNTGHKKQCKKIQRAAIIVKESTKVFMSQPLLMVFPVWSVIAQVFVVIWFMGTLLLIYVAAKPMSPRKSCHFTLLHFTSPPLGEGGVFGPIGISARGARRGPLMVPATAAPGHPCHGQMALYG